MKYEHLRQRLRTVQLVPSTAMDEQLQLALQVQERHFRQLVEAGIRVLIPGAGSAEFYGLTGQEICRLVRLAREILPADGIVVGPVGGPLVEVVRQAEQLARAGADALLVMPLQEPYLCDPGARDYYQRLLDASPLPLLIYQKGPVPSEELILDLADHPQLLGVKHATNQMDRFRRAVLADAGRIDWYCGSAERFAPYYFLAGARGYTSGAGNLCPRLTLAMHRALAHGRWSEAMALQEKILPIEWFRARDGDSYNVTFLKYALAALGLPMGPPRPPMRRLTPQQQQEVQQLVETIRRAEEAVESLE